MKKITTLLFALALHAALAAQKMTFHPKLKVFLNTKANKGYQVKFLNPEVVTTEKKEAETYDARDVLVSYQKKKSPDWTKAVTLDNANAPILSKVATDDFLYAD